jgi:hypothetical protein
MAQVTFIALDSMVLPTFMESDSMARASNKAKEQAARNDGELILDCAERRASVLRR